MLLRLGKWLFDSSSFWPVLEWPWPGVFFEYRSVFVGFDPIIESEVPEKSPLGPTPNGRKVILIVPKL